MSEKQFQEIVLLHYEVENKWWRLVEASKRKKKPALGQIAFQMKKKNILFKVIIDPKYAIIL
ncbi:MAG: hypothetical protein E2O76_11215 [Caldithrix sp.]|nr:MAG: hypothetical protein E2O76_11215 [Caldithrix sp.]